MSSKPPVNLDWMAIKDLPSSTLALLSSKIYFQFSSHTSYFKTCQIMLLLCSQLGNGSHNTQKKFFSVTYKALHYQVSITSLISYSMDLPPNHSSVVILFFSMFFKLSWHDLVLQPMALVCLFVWNYLQIFILISLFQWSMTWPPHLLFQLLPPTII